MRGRLPLWKNMASSIARLTEDFSSVIVRMLRNPYLKSVRNGLTLTLPLVMAGSLAVLLANFPIRSYQDFMTEIFGNSWRDFCVNVQYGTLGLLAPVMLLTISFSLADYYNHRDSQRPVHPAVAALISFGCLLAVIEPFPLDPTAPGVPPGEGLPLFWIGIHGMFMAILVAIVSMIIFFRLLRIRKLRISFFSQESDASVSHAFTALFPGMLTIFIFAIFKTILGTLGVDNINQFIYDLLSSPFAKMGNTFLTAFIYTIIRHIFWFFGIHGTNLLEPVATSLYVPAMQENIAAVAAGLPAPHIFTKSFFDAFIAMGGAGATICLLLAIFIGKRRGSTYKIAQISLLPALFNINEMVMFGIPIVLNPVFLIPFLLVPLVQCFLAYSAMRIGFVPFTTTDIDWTSPVFISGYVSTGSIAGVIMQLVNLAAGVALYIPFVRMADRIKTQSFDYALKELFALQDNPDLPISSEAASLAVSLTNELSGAERRGEIFLEYQPQVESTTGKVFGVEALMRWRHPHLGRIPPGLFIHLAEQSGLVNNLGFWALEESCRQLAEWRREGVDDVVMSVNLSVKQLDDDMKIVDEISACRNRYGIPEGMLKVEITESAMIGGGRSALLQKIHEKGVKLAIDDFGMGHSSLIHLKHFPVDTLKIDRVLSKDVVESRSSAEIIMTIAELCKSLNIEIIVEYVDNKEQLRQLQKLGCTRIQGWLYSPSLSPKDCFAFIRHGAPII